MKLETVYVDMDGVICNYHKAFKEKWSEKLQYPQSQYGFFLNLEPIEDAIESYKLLENYYDMVILTRPSIQNPLSYTEKRVWIEKYLGMEACEKMMLVPEKWRVIGEYLIDDNIHIGENGETFQGEHLHFGQDRFPNWKLVTEYLIKNKR